ncbi:MAG TPA: SRPBCC family protein [Alteraurantiacibacter sp.]
MFGLFKPKMAPEGPVQFVAEVDVAKPAEDVYRLVDWSDPGNAKVELGSSVTPVEGTKDRFLMSMPAVPDLTFELQVTEADPGRCYSFGCEIEPQVGRFVSAHEEYHFEAVGEDSCKLTLVNTVNFIPGMTVKEMEQEIGTMGLASQNALIKLKVHAEMGAEAVKSIEAQQFG